MIRKYCGLYCLVLMGLFVTRLASAQDAFLLRPQAGSGVLDGAHYQHAGFRFLLNANEIQKYGLELTQINTAQGDYVAAGIVLEQRLFGWFNMSIGTIGYYGQGGGAQNQPGLVANLGWEPKTSGPLKPFLTYRNDILFANGKTLVGQALSAGLSIGF